MTTATAGITPCKNDFILNLRTSQLCKSAQYAYWSKNLLRLNMHPRRSIPKEDTKNQPLRFAFSKIHRTWSFHVVALQRTAKKCTKIYNARAQLLFCSLNLLFGDAVIAVVVVACLSSLLTNSDDSKAGVRLHTELDDTNSYYQLNINITISKDIRENKKLAMVSGVNFQTTITNK